MGHQFYASITSPPGQPDCVVRADCTVSDDANLRTLKFHDKIFIWSSSLKKPVYWKTRQWSAKMLPRNIWTSKICTFAHFETSSNHSMIMTLNQSISSRKLLPPWGAWTFYSRQLLNESTHLTTVPAWWERRNHNKTKNSTSSETDAAKTLRVVKQKMRHLMTKTWVSSATSSVWVSAWQLTVITPSLPPDGSKMLQPSLHLLPWNTNHISLQLEHANPKLNSPGSEFDYPDRGLPA